jgi:predicted AAA+ superfamily ATPase
MKHQSGVVGAGPEPGRRFENLVASHLLKWVHLEQDAKGRDIELRYFGDTDRREVDLVVVERRRPILLVECKWGTPRSTGGCAT